MPAHFYSFFPIILFKIAFLVMTKIIGRGAEAIIYRERDALVKERIKKGYRIPQLDEKIRRERTGREESLLLRARRSGLPVPRILEKGKFTIKMDFMEGERLKDVFNSLEKSRRAFVSEKIGSLLALLHSSGIMHGDMTTSNIIFKKAEIFLIDFGLGKVTNRAEDFASDLFLLKEALRAAHFEIMEEAWEKILVAYKKNFGRAGEVLQRLEKIEKRRRYKGRLIL